MAFDLNLVLTKIAGQHETGQYKKFVQGWTKARKGNMTEGLRGRRVPKVRIQNVSGMGPHARLAHHPQTMPEGARGHGRNDRKRDK